MIFKIPQGVDSHNAVILEWTDEGWIIAENEVGLSGGEVDGEDISIVPGHLSEFAIGEWLYNAVFSALKKIPEPPPPTPIIDIQEPVLDDQNNLVMEVNLDSPYGITLNLPKIGSLGLAGMWYCIEVESDNDINVDMNGGIYLPPGIKRDITIAFPPTGGNASICLQTGLCPLPRAAWNWVSRLGLPNEVEAVEEINNIISLTEILLENYELYPNGVWNLEGVVWLIKKLLLQSFWKLTGSKIKYLVNAIPVSIDIATYITASWFDNRPDLCVEFSPQSENIILSYITVSPSTMSLVEGDSQTISSVTAHYSDDSTTDIALDDCIYDSSNPGAATVDTGVITAVTPGTATITVRYTEGDITKSDTVAVTVEGGNVVEFEDPNLEQVIREAIDKPEGPLYLSDVVEIRNLDAEGSGIKSLEGIQHLQNLLFLDFGENQVTDISAVENLTNLQDLEFYTNQVTDISAVENLTNLYDLSFIGNQVTDISAVENLTNLQHLRFHTNQVTDISAVENLTNLHDLNFSGNQVTDITVLKNLTNLRSLGLQHNQVTDISALGNLTNLNYLIFSHNQVTDITVLENLTNLKWLYFYYNQVTDISALVENEGLGTGDQIFMMNNYLDLSEGSQNMQDIETLINRGVSVYYQPQNNP